MANLLNVVIVLLLVFLNGFFVAAEFAVVKVRKSRIETLIMTGNTAAKSVKKIIDNLNAYLSACQLGITLASLGLGWVGEPTVAAMIGPLLVYFNLSEMVIHTISLVVGFSIITACHIVLGELVPKTLSIINAEKVSLIIARPLILFNNLTYPIIWLFNATTNLILKLFGLSIKEEHEDIHTNDELKLLMQESFEHEMIDQTEYLFIERIFGFSEKKAREVMTPRTDMVCIDIEDSIQNINEKHLKEQLTRYPVYKNNKDNIIGFINIKDLYTQLIVHSEANIKDVLRKAQFVPEIMSLSKLLKVMQLEKSQLAILLDEYGGTSGLVTIEDILEEIVGNIQDEYDDEGEEIKVLDLGGYLVEGNVSIDEVNKLLGLNIEAERVSTIGGWISSQIQTIPYVGQSINCEDYCFEISEMLGQRIIKVKITSNDI